MSITLTAAELDQTQAAIDAHIEQISHHPDQRAGAYPYTLFHPVGTEIQGTVLMFHGFSARPHQMWRLADYLHRNGFNVYQANLAGHDRMRPERHWPQVVLKPEYAEPLKQKVKQDPVLMKFVANYKANPTKRPGFVQQLALLGRLTAIEPQMPQILQAIEQPNHPDFDRYFKTTHAEYLDAAQARLTELAAVPGPIYTVGLSVGGAVALGLAAANPERVKKVVAYAPLLRVHGEERRRYVELAGPLEIAELGWDEALRFPVGCLTAADRFGRTVAAQPEAFKTLPTLLVLTENEDAADIETNQQFFEQIGGEAQGHRLFLHPAADLVPHPMVDPEEVSQGMSNLFWRSLYQETLRFLKTGEVRSDNFNRLEVTADLPAPAPLSE